MNRKRRLDEREMAEYVPAGTEARTIAGGNRFPATFSTAQSLSELVAVTDKKNKVLMSIVAITDRLSSHLCSGLLPSQMDFSKLFFCLARFIVCAINFNIAPPNLVNLAALVKQVYKLRYDDIFSSNVFVLMISIKNACKHNWFQAEASNELLLMTNEVFSNFRTDDKINFDIRNAFSIVSMVTFRFYPKMELDRLIFASEAKLGYRILLEDINIPRDVAGKRIRLFVAQTNNWETSSCIITPPDVSFSVNGIGVEKRTNVSMDKGPQFPTDISKFLNYGLNFLQAIGTFNANYLIAIVTMKPIDYPNACNLQSYSQPVAVETDSDVMISQTKIPLNCPISQTRIKTPVKGYRCRHHSCFDFDNFMKMNSVKPSWHCSCCYQPLSFVDLRIDQNMVKILAEVDKSISELVIFADGSWETSKDKHDRESQEETRTLPTESIMVDLTTEEDCEIISPSRDFADWDAYISFQTEDNTKTLQKDNCGLSALKTHADNTTCDIMDPFRVIENDSIFFTSSNSRHIPNPSCIRSTQTVGAPEPSVAVSLSVSNCTDGILPAIYRDSSLASRLQSNYTLENNQNGLAGAMQVAQLSSSNVITGFESGRYATPRNLSGVRVDVPVSTFQEFGNYSAVQANGNGTIEDTQRQFTTAFQSDQLELRMHDQTSQQIVDRLLQNTVSSQPNPNGQTRMIAGCWSGLHPHLNMQNSQFYVQNHMVNNFLEPTAYMPSAEFRSGSQTSSRVSHILAAPIFPGQVSNLQPSFHASSTLPLPRPQLGQFLEGSAQGSYNQILMEHVGATSSRTVQNTRSSQFLSPPAVAGHPSYSPDNFTPANFNARPSHSHPSHHVNFGNGNYGNRL